MSFNRIIIFLLLIATPLFSQYKLKKSVYGGSGGSQSNANNILHSIAGQPIGNQSSNATYNLKEGFIFSFLDNIQLSDEPLAHSNIFTIDSVLNSSSIRFNVQPAIQITNAKGYFILAKANGDPIITLIDGVYPTLYSESNATKIVAISTDVNSNTVTATGLLPNKTYTFLLIPYNWDGHHSASINYKTDGTIPKLTQATPIPTMGEWALIILGLAIPTVVYFKMKT